MVSEKERTRDTLPPHDIDAEEAVIGSLLIDSEAIYQVTNFLEPHDFYREKNRWAYEAILSLYDRNEAINQVTVAQELARRDRLEALGGRSYLSQLVVQVPTSVHVEHYARIVFRLGLMRRLIAASKEVEAIGYEAPPDVDEAMSRAEDVLFRLRRTGAQRDFIPLRSVLDRYFEESSLAPEARGGHLPSIPTGFADLDRIMGGMQRSDMVVLGARPSLGKTSLALNIARNAALDSGAHVAIFSLEMSKMDLAYRFLSCESGVDVQRIRLDQLSDDQRDKVMKATGALSEAPIYIDDSPVLRDSDMRSKARRLHNDKGIDLVIVDYLQLMRTARRTDNPVQEMSEISHSIKALARDIEAPVLAVSQLSRAVEQRNPPIPILSDLRESGSIEQDADVVFLIYRDAFYYNEDQWAKKNPGEPYPKGIADIHIAKHRNGPVGRVNLYFSEKTAKFGDLALERQ